MSELLPPPRARRTPAWHRTPFGERGDDYDWLRDDDREDPEVLAYLAAENAYHAQYMRRLAASQARLYGEIIGRLKQDDASVPVFERGYWYGVRYAPGLEHPVYGRRRATLAAPEEILLDGNERAAGVDYYDVADLSVSDDGQLLAWTEDTVGRREYTLRVRDLAAGRDLPDAIPCVEEDIAWAADGRTVLYVAKDPQTLLGRRVMAHRLGSPPDRDRCIYEQDDESYYTGVYRGRSRRYLYIVSSSTLSTEYRYAPADDDTLNFRVVLGRERNHEYHVEDRGDHFLVLSNAGAPNFRLLEAPAATVGEPATWRELVAHRDDVLLTGCESFRDFVVLGERSRAIHRLRILESPGVPGRVLEGAEPVGLTTFGDNPDFDARRLRYGYTSPTTPYSTYEIDVGTGERTLLKVEPVVGGFDAGRYRTELAWVTARDGARVPVTLCYARAVKRDGTAPLYLYAYGAYGLSNDATFSSSRLSLIDRGFVWAIAHVRGGQELGRAWYDAGRLAHKHHSFDDYIDVTRWLIAEGYADPARVFGSGASAGGLLIGVVANRAPQLYRGLVAHVPFVDVLTSMLDESIPLTTTEYDEWGDPRRAEDYARILAYSPYDNVTAQAYPALLVTAGLWDSQVQYWEPAKWVARLRALKTNDAPLLLRVDLESGHGGKSGRYERLTEVAEEYAFLLDLAGIDV